MTTTGTSQAEARIVRLTSALLDLIESPMQDEDAEARAFWNQALWAAKRQLRHLIAELND